MVAIAEDADGVVIAGEGLLARWADVSAIGDGMPEWEFVNAVDPGYEALVLSVELPEAIDVVAFHADGILAVDESGADAELLSVGALCLRPGAAAKRGRGYEHG